MPDTQIILSKLDEIEAEMQRVGLWQNGPLEPGQYDFRSAFALDTMTFTQWLQFIFIPNVRSAATMNQFPSESHVAAQAVGEFDTVPDASQLVNLLSEFDALF